MTNARTVHAGLRALLLAAAAVVAVALAQPAYAQVPTPRLPWLPGPAQVARPAVDTPAATPADATPTAAPETAVDEGKLAEPAFVTLAVPADVSVGRPLIAQATATNAEGRPLDNKVMLIYLDGEVMRRMRTDAEGKAEIRLPADLAVGDYKMKVVVEATQAYQEASAEQPFTVRPAIVKMITVPTSPGIEFILDGKTFVTDEEGIAYITVNMPGVYDLEAVIPEALTATEERGGFEFARWDDDQFMPKRTLDVSGDMEKYVGIAHNFMINMTFLDRNGVEVDPARIEEIVVKASTGTRYKLEAGKSYPFTANRVARLQAGLVPTEVQYGFESVIIDGANVVNQNQQRFILSEDTTWPVNLLLFDAKIRAADAFFGFPVGTGISLTYPSGKYEFIAFNEENEAVIHNLARGVYKLQVQGVSGMAPVTPVVISRDQDATLKVLSTLDMAAVGSAGAIGALGLLLLGRPHLTRLGRTGARRRAEQPAATPATAVAAQIDRGPVRPPSPQPPDEKAAPPAPRGGGRRERKPQAGARRSDGLPTTGYRHFRQDPDAPRVVGKPAARRKNSRP